MREHLEAFYPGAFTTVARRAAFAPGDNVVLSGDLLRFKEGNFGLRIIVGMGAGKDKLEADIAFKDGRDGKTLYAYRLLESNWGAGWQTKQGQLRDMLDQAGRDLAYLLVSTLVPNYAPPRDLEICFDGAPYPPLV